MRNIFASAGLTPSEIQFVELHLKDDGSRLTLDTGEFISSMAYAKLFDYFACEMPYGVAKCRTGEPDVWILDRLEEIEERNSSHS